jgi:XTP/dITP diphosphohydrolase
VVSFAAPDVDEDQPTFEGNAEKKARACAAASGLLSLADDSGLCVDALDGRPGVKSARYAPGDDRARIDKLLGELRDVEARAASFRCALSLALPGGEVFTEVGRCDGRIGRAPRGANGFGYDPVFVLGDGRTMAELSQEEKSRVSHRADAFRRMKPRLVALTQGSSSSASNTGRS